MAGSVLDVRSFVRSPRAHTHIYCVCGGGRGAAVNAMDVHGFTVHGSPVSTAAVPPQALWFASAALGLVAFRLLSLFRHA